MDADYQWASIDPATGKSGVALWEGSLLQATFVIKKRGNKGAYYCGSTICESRRAAWGTGLKWAVDGTVIIEKGAGDRPNVVNAQGWLRGYIEHACEMQNTGLRVVSVSEWRRVIREAQGISWPSGRDPKKQLAIRTVKDLYGVDVTDDEADAVLLGHAALRMGMVEKQGGK